MVKKSELEKFENLLRDSAKDIYILKLYITGMTPNSKRAVENVKKICDEYLRGRYELEIIDVYQQPSRAEGGQIIAVPTLVKMLPQPFRKLIGDMSNKERVIVALDLKERKEGQ
jgi:circadian clock protein KaiB